MNEVGQNVFLEPTGTRAASGLSMTALERRFDLLGDPALTQPFLANRTYTRNHNPGDDEVQRQANKGETYKIIN